MKEQEEIENISELESDECEKETEEKNNHQPTIQADQKESSDIIQQKEINETEALAKTDCENNEEENGKSVAEAEANEQNGNDKETEKEKELEEKHQREMNKKLQEIAYLKSKINSLETKVHSQYLKMNIGVVGAAIVAIAFVLYKIFSDS